MSSMMKRAMVCKGVVLLLSAGCADGGVTLIADGDVQDSDSGVRDDAQPRGDAGPDAAPDAWVPPDSGADAGAQQDAGVEQDAGPPPCEDVYCADDDSDGYGDPNDCVETCTPPPGYVDNGDDCYDNNDDAKPGQSTYYETDRGDGSFDYNCDEAEERLWTSIGECEESTGWVPSVPDCGVVEWWKQFPDTCGPTSQLRQKCI